MPNNEIFHWGIKGQKWGVRRYQNADGTLTPAGKKRYDQDVSDLSEKKKKSYKANPNKWVEQDLEKSKRVMDETEHVTNKVKNSVDSSIRKTQSKKTKMDLSSMTDQEMRNKINRELLERQYNDMFAPQKSTKGREFVSKLLETTGTVLAIGSSSLGIALAIKQLRG